jgi:hypothetical protein
MRHPLYALYSAVLLGWLGYSAYNGTPFFGASVNEQRVIPKSVRDNPGAYRSSYGGYTRYIGGK